MNNAVIPTQIKDVTRAPNTRARVRPPMRKLKFATAPPVFLLEAVGEGVPLEPEAEAVPLTVVARLWNAEKLRGDDSSLLTANTIPEPQ